jgi:hypothetical protein
MPYRIKKSIQQYSLVDLLEILKYQRHPEHQSAVDEFNKRNPSQRDLEIAKKGLEIRAQSRNKSLSFTDVLYCFIIPFIAPKNPFVINQTEIDEEYEMLSEEFEIHGESKRIQELKKWRSYIETIYAILAGLLILSLIIWL